MQVKVNIGRLSNVPLHQRPAWMEHILSEINVGVLIIRVGGGGRLTSTFYYAMIDTRKSELDTAQWLQAVAPSSELDVMKTTRDKLMDKYFLIVLVHKGAFTVQQFKKDGLFKRRPSG